MKEKNDKQQRIADKNFNPEFYKGETQFKKELANTHEQVSDSYYEGSTDKKLKD